MKLKRVLYLGWLRHGNVGDDLLFTVFQELITAEALKNNIGLMIDVLHEEYAFSMQHYDLVVLGGGSLLNIPYYPDICLKAQSLQIPVIVWGSGVDIRDSPTVYTVLYSFFNNKDSDELKHVINHYYKIKGILEYAEIVGVRGIVTKYLLHDNKVKVIGDPGILIDKFGYKYPVNTEIDEFAGESENVVLVNWGTSNNNILGGNERIIYESLLQIIQMLLTGKYKIILYPIWTQDINSCINLAGKFNDSNLFLVDKVYDFLGIVSLIKKCKYSINFKLHANILSMAMQKPFISLAYGLKCYDFAQSIDAMDLVIPTDRVSGKEVMKRIDYVERNYEKIKSRFRKEIIECYENHAAFMQAAVAILNKS